MNKEKIQEGCKILNNKVFLASLDHTPIEIMFVLSNFLLSVAKLQKNSQLAYEELMTSMKESWEKHER